MKNFVKNVTKEIKAIYPEARVEVQEVIKLNDIKLHGLTILFPSTNVSPTIYLEDFFEDYKQGVSIDSIIEDIVKIYEKGKSNFEMPKFDFDDIKGGLKCKLINTGRNIELLSKIPSIYFLDLSIIFYWDVLELSGQSATITVTNALMERWHKSTSDLLEVAKENTGKDMYFNNMIGILEELITDDVEQSIEKDSDTFAMYVLSNSKKMFGASLIACDRCMKKISNALHGDFIIIPSSIHEVIILPWNDDIQDFSELRSMVAEVNNTQVLESEILSYNVYCYKRAEKKVSILY